MIKLYRTLITLMVVFTSIQAFAYDFAEENEDGVTIYYNIISQEDKTCEVTYKDDSYNSYSGIVTIPSNVSYLDESYSVKIIGKYAFLECNNLTKVSISDNITSIDDCAFYKCSKLNSLPIGDGLKLIGSKAFYQCTQLSEITIPNSVTFIGSNAFEGCTHVTSIYR